MTAEVTSTVGMAASAASSIADWLIWLEWHHFEPGNGWHLLYAAWNGVEGCCWLWCAWLVWRRWRMLKQSRLLEPIYAGLFVLFGLSDFYEAWRVPSWLLLAKLGILIALLLVRRHVRRHLHPGAKLV